MEKFGNIGEKRALLVQNKQYKQAIKKDFQSIFKQIENKKKNIYFLLKVIGLSIALYSITILTKNILFPIKKNNHHSLTTTKENFFLRAFKAEIAKFILLVAKRELLKLLTKLRNKL